MSRPILDESALHPAIRERVAKQHAALLKEAQSAVATNPVVVFGMAGNPFVRKARKALDAAGVAHVDIDHGGYFSQWRERNALKLWTGWPTFPMVFVKGVLVGGADDLAGLIARGELKKLLG
jgi:glutaredoxin-related protein